MKPILALILVLAATNRARAEDFVFETGMARLVIRSDALVISLMDKQSGKERLRPGTVPFAAVGKGGKLFPASDVDRRGDRLHVTFGRSGVDADYRISARANYILVELTAFHGDGIEEIRLMQLDVSLANAGGPLGVWWDDEFAVCLMGLSAQVNSRVGERGRGLLASVYPGFSMQGERIAIIAAPTPRFMETVRMVEQDFRLPSPMLGGKWAKVSEDVRTSYLFSDLTEANADETIQYAKLGGFRYILVYNWAWSSSLGSYPINTRNFPRGEESLKVVIDKCHAAGLKVGMHMLTGFVGKDDSLVTPEPNPGLLKDAVASLAADVNEKATELSGTSALAGFPLKPGGYGPANDILIDDEIIQYTQIRGTKLVRCMRGFAGTRPAMHNAGTKIFHLAEREGSYLADLRTSLKDAISDRVAGLINRCGFDMIDFDGGEALGNRPIWYWMGVQQMQIWEKSQRELLVEGSGMTSWTWHIFSRGTSDDYSAVAPKEYLDYHKIADYWKSHRDNFLPAELGWTGFLQYAPDHPATTPDELEYYATRMLALDSAVSFETTLDALKANGRTEEMLKLLGDYERLRLSGAVPKASRQMLASGEWHMTSPGEFHPIRYDAQYVATLGEITVRNEFPAQPLKFRLQAAPTLAPLDDPSNINLLQVQQPVEIQPPDAKAVMPGSLIRRVEFPKPLDLTTHRALAVRIEVKEVPEGSAETPVLNIQLEAGGQTYRDYYVDLNVSGPRSITLTEPGTKRMLAEFRPASANYPFKSAMYGFNYGNVVALNVRWMRYPKGSSVQGRISGLEALAERSGTLKNIKISAGQFSIAIPEEMKTGDYAEYWADGKIRVFDRNGITLSTFPVASGPQLATGANKLTWNASGSGSVVLTAITLGN